MVITDPPRPPGRRRLLPAARRAEILAAAERLLRLKGPQVRVNDIMVEAGAAKGTFFAYFPTFDDLLDAIRSEKAGKLEQAVSDALASTGQPQWESVLPRLAAVFVDFVIDLGGLHEVLFHSAFTQARPMPPDRRPSARIAAIIRAGLAAGAYAEVDADPTAVLIFAAIHETADAIMAGADRRRSLAALNLMLRRALFASDEPAAINSGEG